MKHDILATLGVSRETERRLRIYTAILLKWNPTINLISRRDESLVWDRHVLDSLALLATFPSAQTHAIDLGSGGGFPGIVLAIATDTHFHLVEADQRKAAFLREASRATAAPTTIHPVRIEAAIIEPAPVVTARALAPLDRLLTLAAPLLAPGGICLFHKGRMIDDELTAAQTHWHMQAERLPSATDPTSTILRVRGLSRVGA